METHSSVLAWRIPGTAEPDGLASTGSHRAGHDWSDLAAAAVESNTKSPRALRKCLLTCLFWMNSFLCYLKDCSIDVFLKYSENPSRQTSKSLSYLNFYQNLNFLSELVLKKKKRQKRILLSYCQWTTVYLGIIADLAQASLTSLFSHH